MNPQPWLPALSAFVAVVVTLPGVLAWARHWRLYDEVGPLKIHVRPVPRLGGVALAVAMVTGVVAAGGSHRETAALGLSALAVWLIGVVNDLHELSPALRIVVQSGAALLLWLAVGRVWWTRFSLLDLLLVWVFVLLVVNSFNLLDGADGLAAGVAGIIAIGYLALASGENLLSVVVAASLLGACAGFLLFNFPPAKIFMGDAGSTLLGIVIAYLGLDFSRAHAAVSARLLVPFVFAALPLLDLVFAVVRRLRAGTSPFQGDRRHLYDLLLRRGWSPRQVAGLCYAMTAAFVLVGSLSDATPVFVCLLTISTVAILVAAVLLGSLRPEAIQAE